MTTSISTAADLISIVDKATGFGYTIEAATKLFNEISDTDLKKCGRTKEKANLRLADAAYQLQLVFEKAEAKRASAPKYAEFANVEEVSAQEEAKTESQEPAEEAPKKVVAKPTTGEDGELELTYEMYQKSAPSTYKAAASIKFYGDDRQFGFVSKWFSKHFPEMPVEHVLFDVENFVGPMMPSQQKTVSKRKPASAIPMTAEGVMDLAYSQYKRATKATFSGATEVRFTGDDREFGVVEKWLTKNFPQIALVRVTAE